MAVCEVISRFLHILVNQLIKIRKYNSPYLFNVPRKSVFYLGVGIYLFTIKPLTLISYVLKSNKEYKCTNFNQGGNK